MIFEENFTEEQINILERYVSSTTSNIYVLKNLPEIIKGALFSRYSRSTSGLRTLLLKEFILNENFSFSNFIQSQNENVDQILAVQKAQNFYEKILEGFGDDSIGELGGAHLAIENVSIIAAKAIEDCRIGGSPLEKSTRYIYFDQKVNGDYKFYKEPILMTSAYKEIYLNTCRLLFDTYSKLIFPMTELLEKQFPKNENISENAYKAALKAKVLDCLRGLLPVSTFTNLGVFGNGRFFENLIRKLLCNDLSEFQEIAKISFTELSKVIPSFIKRSEELCPYQIEYTNFIEQTRSNLKILSAEHSRRIAETKKTGVYLINYDPSCVAKICAALLFEYNQVGLKELQNYCSHLSNHEILQIFEAGSSARENRRHKSPRALENANFTFEITADFGIYRDLQRHRMLTQDRQLLSCERGYYTPTEIVGTDMEKEYENAMKLAKRAHDIIAQELPEEAQYVVPMAYNLHWYMNINLRSLQWLCELRSSPAGHPNYRYVAQEMAKQVCFAIPEFEHFFKFVDYEGYNLGRISQEIKRVEKLKTK
jgi:thymidylate synthase ThyX